VGTPSRPRQPTRASGTSHPRSRHRRSACAARSRTSSTEENWSSAMLTSLETRWLPGLLSGGPLTSMTWLREMHQTSTRHREQSRIGPFARLVSEARAGARQDSDHGRRDLPQAPALDQHRCQLHFRPARHPRPPVCSPGLSVGSSMMDKTGRDAHRRSTGSVCSCP
jgi:hypothetical protein